MNVHAKCLGLACVMAASFGAHAANKLDFAGNYATRYDSKDNADRPADQTFGSPEDAARPGAKYFFTAARAIRDKDYAFAINMYEVSASWGYKPAQYNLGIMYAKGEGVPVDRARGMAWMALAAERGDQRYVEAREVIYADLSKDEFAHANELWRELKKTYGDDVAFERAKVRWAQVKSEMTGSRVGAAGPLMIGSANAGGQLSTIQPTLKARPDPPGPKGSGNTSSKPGNSSVNGFATAAFGVLGGSGEDGSIAYRQLRESNNPYDPKFEWHNSPIMSGTATVGPVIQGQDAEAEQQPRDR
jgi:hypothetical protein